MVLRYGTVRVTYIFITSGAYTITMPAVVAKAKSMTSNDQIVTFFIRKISHTLTPTYLLLPYYFLE